MAEIRKSVEITPEQRAEMRAELKKDMERAKAAGVYQRALDLHERRVRERAAASMLRDGEPRSVRTAEEEEAYYRSIQLTPEQKAELRAEAKKNCERAAAAGVYKRLREAHEQAVRERAMEATLRDAKVHRKK